MKDSTHKKPDEAQESLAAFEIENETIAIAAYNVNKVFCIFIGDDSQPEWDNAPDWQKDSVINGVEFTRLNPESTPKDSHKSWMKQKSDEGWTYGEVKDPKMRIHPCMLAYSELPKEQRTKDKLFQAVVKSLINHG